MERGYIINGIHLGGFDKKKTALPLMQVLKQQAAIIIIWDSIPELE